MQNGSLWYTKGRIYCGNDDSIKTYLKYLLLRSAFKYLSPVMMSCMCIGRDFL